MWKKLTALLLIILAIAASIWYYLRPVEPIYVNAVQPLRQTLSHTLDLNALVINERIVTITALLNGEIKQTTVREGERVDRGQTLAVLNAEEAQSLLGKAQAELAYKRQKLNTARKRYARVKNLSSAGNTSKQTLDDSLDTFKSAEAELSIAEASLQLAELRLKNGNIIAPFAGIITKQHVETGQWVEAGTPLFRLVDELGYLIEAQVDASDWSQVSLGQLVALSTESAPDNHWQSAVTWMAPVVALNERDAKSVAIRFKLGNESPPLLLGQEVDAALILEQVDDVLTLPLTAMQEVAPGEFAVFRHVDNKASYTPLDVGLINATHAQVTGGIKQDDVIVYSLKNTLADAMAIEITGK